MAVYFDSYTCATYPFESYLFCFISCCILWVLCLFYYPLTGRYSLRGLKGTKVKAVEVIQEVKKALDKTKEAGEVSVSIDAMGNFMDQLEVRAQEVGELDQLEHERLLTQFEAENARNIAYSQNINAHSLEMFKSVIATGQAALKSSMVINGGAAAALLAFTGKIWSEGSIVQVTNALTHSILLFCAGLLIASFASGTTYLSQLAYAKDWNKVGGAVNAFTVLTVLASYAMFGFGCFNASNSLALHFGTL